MSRCNWHKEGISKTWMDFKRVETSECAGKNSSIRIFRARSYNFFSEMQREVKKTSFFETSHSARTIFLITFLTHKNLVGFYITICKRYFLRKKRVSMGLLKIILIFLSFFYFLLKFQKVPILNLETSIAQLDFCFDENKRFMGKKVSGDNLHIFSFSKI